MKAHAKGLFPREFALELQYDNEPGSMRIRDASAEMSVQRATARIEPVGKGVWHMTSAGEELLVARRPKSSSNTLTMECSGKKFEAETSLFRNRAIARTPGGRETALVEGGMMGRRYDVRFDVQTEGSLPASIFLLFYLISGRSRAYRAGVKP